MLKRILERVARQQEQGFSMLELLIYVGIVGIIVSFAVPKYTNAVAMGNTAKIQADLQTLDSAIGMYQLTEGKAPSAITDLSDYVNHVDSLKPPTGKCYVKSSTEPVEVTGTAYTLSSDGDEAMLDEKTLDKFGRQGSASE